MLMKSFRKSCPPQKIHLPGLETTMVFQRIMIVPYKPLHEAVDKDLTLRVAPFLHLSQLSEWVSNVIFYMMIISQRGGDRVFIYFFFLSFLNLWQGL